MTARILDGNALAKNLRSTLKSKIDMHIMNAGSRPSLSIILVGDQTASSIYVNRKIKACSEVGIDAQILRFNESIAENELISTIKNLNNDAKISGILVQLPLPAHIKNELVLLAIDPLKDVDGFHPENIGLLAVRAPRLSPATPCGIMKILNHYVGSLEGLHAVIVGASNIVGRPMGLELLNQRVTVTICHSKTRDLNLLTTKADLLIAAAGVHGLITAKDVKPGAIVVDVGIHRLESGDIRGDVLFEEVSERAAWITPVPGGVGPMTIFGLLENTLKAAELALSKKGRDAPIIE